MAEFMILKTPAALLLCGAALFLCLFDRARHASRGWFSVLSAALALLGVGVDLLHGADLREAAALLTVFLLLHLTAPAGGEKEGKQ